MTRTALLSALAVVVAAAAVTIPIWGMAPAVFLDSQRTILSRHHSPDRSRIAQVERLVVGGVPSIIVVVRSSWMPNWYLTGCVASSHYGDTEARAFWRANDALTVMSAADPRYWKKSAPFKRRSCTEVEVDLVRT